MPHANEQILRSIDEAQAKGDPDEFFGHFTEDVKVHIQGNNKLTGDYQGRGQMREVFGRFVEAAGDDYSFETHGNLADDEHGVSFQTSHFSRDGKKVDLDETFVVHFREGKVSEVWYLPLDIKTFDELMGR